MNRADRELHRRLIKAIHSGDEDTMSNLLVKYRILQQGGDQSASVIRELTNKGKD